MVFERRPSKRKTPRTTAEKPNACDNAPVTPSSSPSSSGGNPPLDADLRRLIRAWPTLPEPVRAGIVAMVEAVAGGG